MTKMKKAKEPTMFLSWAVRLDEFEGQPIYHAYPTLSRNMVRSLVRDQKHRNGKLVLVSIRELRQSEINRKTK